MKIEAGLLSVRQGRTALQGQSARASQLNGAAVKLGPYPFRAFQKIGNGLSSTPVTPSRIAAGWKNWPSGT